MFACSALKRSYRDLLRAASTRLRVVHLAGSQDLVRDRLTARRGHFMPPTLLPSQFRTLEPPESSEHPIVIDIAATPARSWPGSAPRSATRPRPEALAPLR
ncbi:MAG: hypothetical protein WDO24_10600 [Pseudomonadota bacterium]